CFRYFCISESRAWPRIRLTPANARIRVIEITAARLTAALRQKLCQALLSANARCRESFMVSPGPVVSGDLALIDEDDAAPHQVDDVAVMSGHHDRRAVRVDLQEELHDLPRRRGVEVAGGLVG